MGTKDFDLDNFEFSMDGVRIVHPDDITIDGVTINAEITADNHDTIYKPLNISVSANFVNNKAFRKMKRKHRRMIIRKLIIEGLQTCFKVMI